MTIAPSFKPALSSCVAVAFAVLAATGGLLFFDVEARPIEALHQWFGWVFVLAGIVHLAVHWHQLAAYLRLRAARWSLASVLLLAAGLVALGWAHREEERPADPAPAGEHARGPARTAPVPAAKNGPADAPAFAVLPASLPVLAPLSCPT